MNATEINYFKSFLLSQKSSILNKTSEFKSESITQRDTILDEAETVSHEQSLSMSIHLHERDRSVLLQIEKALGKLENGTFGVCEACGDDIEQKRLKARPFACLCVVCKEEQEDPRNRLN